MTRKLPLAIAVLALAPASIAFGKAGSLDSARDATDQYHQLSVAKDDGYGIFKDAAGIACIDNPAGGMGVHYVRGAIVGDGQVDATTPEALVYEPQANGRMRLVAVEYVVFQADWDANHASPPSLFGQEFEAVSADNRYGLPPFYELHAWIWRHNPSGMFEDWNPRVTCDAA
jgi:hypothetical protein